MTQFFDRNKLKEMLLKKNYSFPDNPFEPSSDQPIDEDKLLSFAAWTDYLDETYGTGEKPSIHRENLEKIIGPSLAQHLIGLNKSEYYKVLTHFAVLSRVKRGWFNLFVTLPIRTTKPSLSDNPSYFARNESKKLHDAIVWCFYFRLIQGMTAQEKERYPMLLPRGHYPTGFDGLIVLLDQAIQNLFSLLHQNTDGFYDERSLPDAGLDEAIEQTRTIVHEFLSEVVDQGHVADTLRATLIKLASLNRATNDIDAILSMYSEVWDSLPNDIQPLIEIESESEILPALTRIFESQPSDRKNRDLPDDLIKCSRLVCRMYINASPPPTQSAEDLKGFSDSHTMPIATAVSGALLYHDYLTQKKLSLNVRGETNKSINAYKMLSDLAKRITTTDRLTSEDLWGYGFPEELFKYLTSRYSISRRGLSYFYPSRQGAEAHLKVRIKKLELQKETYGLLKDITFEDAHQFISNLFIL